MTQRIVTQPAAAVRTIYRRLWRRLGPQGWWPADGPFEMMVGAILTQATNWHNVERALTALRRARALRPARLAALPPRRIQQLIRPAGYFRQKALRVRGLARWYLRRYDGSRRRMARRPWPALRQELLALPGVGPETADAMLLYAAGHPVFVVDAYTTRIFRRHYLLGPRPGYEEVQQLVMEALAAPAQVYNEFHALLVAVGKRHCHRRAPDCAQCPLGDLAHTTR
jgi:endonuclease-3 related protein